MTRHDPAPGPAIPLDAWARRGARRRIFGHEIFAVATAMLEAPERWATAALAFLDGQAR